MPTASYTNETKPATSSYSKETVSNTSYENELAPGQPWEYNEPFLTYNQIEFDDLVIYYNSFGLVSVYVNETK